MPLAASPLSFQISLAAVVLLFAVVIIIVPDRFFADDTYFYFQVAWNFARGMGSTFNNVLPTNGYHPLWMLCCALVFKVLPQRATAVYGIGFEICLLDAVTLFVLGRLLRRLQVPTWPLAFLVYAPFCFLTQLGTEGALSGCMLALLLLAGLRLQQAPTRPRSALWNLFAALAILSRLDNIFVVGCLWLAAGFALLRFDRRALPAFLLCGSIPVALCGFYIWTNLHFFGLIEPVSGYLKSHSQTTRLAGVLGHLPHTGQLSLLLVLLGTAFLAIRCRDRFFLTAELPFACGVLVHALYIIFRMSTETRWTWYYTSWVLLAALVLARCTAILLGSISPGLLVRRVGWFTVAALALLWFRVSFLHFVLHAPVEPALSFQHAVYEQAGLRRVLAYDQPGRMAYYSDVQVITLDGLMSDLNFQHELPAEGIEAYIQKHGIDGYVGYPAGESAASAANTCGKLFLDSTITRCLPTADGHFNPVSVEIFARAPLRSAGILPLPASSLVWNRPDYVGVWRVH